MTRTRVAEGASAELWATRLANLLDAIAADGYSLDAADGAVWVYQGADRVTVRVDRFGDGQDGQ